MDAGRRRPIDAFLFRGSAGKDVAKRQERAFLAMRSPITTLSRHGMRMLHPCYSEGAGSV